MENDIPDDDRDDADNEPPRLEDTVYIPNLPERPRWRIVKMPRRRVSLRRR